MTHSQRKRIALIGVGTHGMNAVLPAIGHAKEWELVAVVDNNPAHLQKLPHLRGYGAVETMLQEEEVDAIYIATLPNSHCAIALAGLRHGAHVVCEKPMGADAGETRIMLDAAREAGRELVVMFENRFQPYYRKVRQWIREGAVGRVEAIHLQSFGKHPIKQPRRTHLLNAAGCLDCGIHMLDIARYWNEGARWETIHALGTWFDEPVERPPHVGILARLDNGVMVTFEDSFSYGYRLESVPWNFGKNSLTIVGTQGVITDASVENGREIQLISDARRESVPIIISEHEHEIPKVLDAFAAWLRGAIDEETAASLARGEDGHEAQRIVDEVNNQSVATRMHPMAEKRDIRRLTPVDADFSNSLNQLQAC